MFGCGAVSNQRRNRDTDKENRRLDTKRGRGNGRNWEIGTDTYTLLLFNH